MTDSCLECLLRVHFQIRGDAFGFPAFAGARIERATDWEEHLKPGWEERKAHDEVTAAAGPFPNHRRAAGPARVTWLRMWVRLAKK